MNPGCNFHIFNIIPSFTVCSRKYLESPVGIGIWGPQLLMDSDQFTADSYIGQDYPKYARAFHWYGSLKWCASIETSNKHWLRVGLQSWVRACSFGIYGSEGRYVKEAILLTQDRYVIQVCYFSQVFFKC